jgi:2-desacetyl-2-hydroxyethyl bacteriochlorophyllide A dehydrogenase
MMSENTARAFWVREPGAGELRTSTLPVPSAGQVQVRSLWSAISRGTESLVFRGQVPEALHDDMRAPFQEGDFPGPVKYGYMNVGVVEAAPDGPELEGRFVFCLYPHQDRYVVPATAVVPIPEGVPAARAVLAANVETALNGVWDGGVGPGDRVVVIGAGVVGLLAARIAAQIPATEVTVVDPSPARERAADELGLVWRSEPPEGVDADVVLHASGTAAGARSALASAGVEATVVELSWFGTREVPLPLGEAFHPRRLILRSSQVGRIPPGRAPRWTYRRRMEAVMRLLGDPALDTLFSEESAFEDLPTTMPRLVEGAGEVLCHRIRY